MWKIISIISVVLMGICGSTPDPDKTRLTCVIHYRDCVFFSKNIRANEPVSIEVDWNNSEFNNVSWVQKVNFTDSNVEEIPTELLRKFPRLIDFSLEGQGVKRLFRKTFRGGVLLRQIYMPFNLIEKLDEDLFAEAVDVEFIHFSNNQIKKVDRNAFRQLYHLNYLSLRTNNIEELHEFVFSDLWSLQILYLHQNKLTHLPQNLLKNNKALEIVYFSDNRITSLEPTMFSHLSKLATLTMTGNKCINSMWIETTNQIFDWVEYSLRNCAPIGLQ